MRTLALPLLLVACHKDDGPSGSLVDTGWFEDTSVFEPENCPNQTERTIPEDGEDSWYYRRPMRVISGAGQAGVYAARILGPTGAVVPSTMVWEDNGIAFGVVPDAPLEASADHILEITDCLGVSDIHFRTSALGAPLGDGPSSLVGRTYDVDLFGADWLEPAGFGPILGVYFEAAILIGVEWADEHVIDLMGAPGYQSYTGELVQDTDLAIWDFPVASFVDAPFFDSTAAQVDLEIDDYVLPIKGFHLTATFGADGRRFGGGTLEGVGDTRDLGPLVGQGADENAVCDLAGNLGVSCIACDDGKPLCLRVRLADIEGKLVDGLRLERPTP